MAKRLFVQLPIALKNSSHAFGRVIRLNLLYLCLLLVPFQSWAECTGCVTFDEITVATAKLKVYGPFSVALGKQDSPPEGGASVPIPPPKPTPDDGGVIVAQPAPLLFHKPLETFDVTDWGLEGIDLSIAASHTHLVLTSSHRIAFATKNGTLLKSMYTVDLFSQVKDDMNKVLEDPVDSGPLKYPITEFYDTRLIFDSYRNRFWIECLVRNFPYTNDPKKKEYRVTLTAIAVSKTEDPLDGFFTYWWGSGNGTPPKGARDYQSLGISEKLLAVARQTDEAQVAQADPMAAGSRIQPPVTLLKNINLSKGKVSTINLSAVLHQGPSPLGRQLLASNPEWNRIIVWVLNPDNLGTLHRAEVRLQTSEPPVRAGQKSHPEVPNPMTLHPGMTLIQKAVYREGKLYAVWTVGRRWKGSRSALPSIQLVRLDVSGAPESIPTGRTSGKIDLVFGERAPSDPVKALFSYCWPTIDVTKNGTMALAYIRSSAAIFPEAYYSLYRAQDPGISHSALMHEGEYPVTPPNDPDLTGKLDYSGSAVDPADDLTVYVLNAYGSRQASGKGVYKLIVGKVWTEPTLTKN